MSPARVQVPAPSKSQPTAAPAIRNEAPAGPNAAPGRASAPIDPNRSHHFGRLAVRTAVQPKLTISDPQDPLEQEADRVAAAVMRAPEPSVQRGQVPGATQPLSKDGGPVRTSLLNAPIFPPAQRKATSAGSEQRAAEEERGEDEEEETSDREKKPLRIRAMHDPGAPPAELPALADALEGARGQEVPLPPSVREFFEPRFGHNFSHVRVHADGRAAEMARSIHARAFTHGKDIFFGAGEYQPETAAGRSLIAHELAHTLQQTGPRPASNQLLRKTVRDDGPVTSPSRRRDPAVSPADQPLEPPEVAGSAAERVPSSNPPSEEVAAPVAEEVERRASEAAPEAEPGLASEREAEPEPPPREQAAPTTAPEASDGGAAPRPPVAAQLAGDPGGLLAQLTDVAPTAAFSIHAQAEAASEKALKGQRDALQARLPRITAPTGIRPKQGDGAEQRKTVPRRASPGRLVKQTAPLARGPQRARVRRRGLTPERPSPAVEHTTSRPADREGIGLESPAIPTHAGPPPAVDLSGEADPAQLMELRARSDQDVAGAKAESAQEIQRDRGESDIRPKPDRGILQLKALTVHAPTRSRGGKPPTFPPDIAGGLDSSLGSALKARIGEQRDRYTGAEDQLDRDVDDSRRKAEGEIGEHTKTARDGQRAEQKKAKAQVEKLRGKGQEELDKVDKEHREKALKATRDGERQVAGKKGEAERKVGEHLANAERKAAAKKREAEEEVEKKKADASKESGGFVTWLKSAASTLIEGLKRTVDFIYDNLRKAVREIFDAAKALVQGVIELARRAIVGIIQGVGELLKGFVRVTLIAFPKIAERINRGIDAAVGAAVGAVNAIAEGLKKAVAAVLDFLATAVDKLLGLVQSLYNAVFTLIGMLIRGELKKILEGIGNLVQAARQMPDHFWGQAQEELIGMNLSQSLPFERSAPAGPAVAGRSGESARQLSQASVDLLGRDRLRDDDIQMDEVAELDLPPDFLAGLRLAEGEEVVFGENAGPAWTAASLQAEALGAEPAVGGASPQATEGESRSEAGAVALKTPEEELEELLAQQPEGGCTKEKTAEPATAAAVPEHLKKGPFTPTQRGRYLLHQMKEGVRQWFSCNWPWLLTAAVAGLVGFIALNILTGGALLAALPLLMQIVGAVMIGVAIVKITRHVGDYLTRGFTGDIDSAAKSLARGLAVGAIELVFALLFNIGAVVKALRGGLTGAARAAGAAAKATIRTTLRNVREVGRLGVQAGKALLRNGKLILTGGLRRGFARGARSLGELARRLWVRVRFRRFKLRRAGKRIQLWGYINPWVLMADGTIEEVTFKGSGDRPQLGMLTQVGKKQGILVGVRDTDASAFVKHFDSLGNAEAQALFKELKNMDDAARRAAIAGIGQTAENARVLRGAMTNGGVRPDRGVPGSGNAAHHIVPSTHSYSSADEARQILAQCGIKDVNHKLNGVFVPPKIHAYLHTHKYMDAVRDALRPALKVADDAKRLDFIESALDALARKILRGDFTPE